MSQEYDKAPKNKKDQLAPALRFLDGCSAISLSVLGCKSLAMRWASLTSRVRVSFQSLTGVACCFSVAFELACRRLTTTLS